MNIDNLDFLVYSSHKTATQSLLSILSANKYRVIHCHTIINFQLYQKELKNKSQLELNTIFIESLIKYKLKNKKKIKILSVIRNPIERLKSSFFQTYHTDEISYNKKKENNTTISINNISDLIHMYNNKIQTQTLPYYSESLDELAFIFDIDIISKLVKRETYNNKYYYFEHDLFELFVIDFTMVIGVDNLVYINKCLGINLHINKTANLTQNKSYCKKYKEFKNNIKNNMVNANLDKIIISNYNDFYFHAFT